MSSFSCRAGHQSSAAHTLISDRMSPSLCITTNTPWRIVVRPKERFIHTYTRSRRPLTPSLMPNFLCRFVSANLLLLLFLTHAICISAAQPLFPRCAEQTSGLLCRYFHSPSSARDILCSAFMPATIISFNHEYARKAVCMLPCCRARLPSLRLEFACPWCSWVSQFHS